MSELSVKFYNPEDVKIEKLKFVVIQAKYKDKWIFVRHKERDTLEIPGGHIEENETPDEAAKRELYEESGAIKFVLRSICAYSVCRKDEEESYGMLYYGEVEEIGDLPEYEIAEIKLLDELPNNLTYESIQPLLFEKVHEETRKDIIAKNVIK